MTPEPLVGGMVLAFIAQAGLLLATWMQHRRTRQERQASAVDIMQDVNSELRLELDRMHRAIAGLTDENTTLTKQLRQAVVEARGAHETAGRALQRVNYLESLLRAHAINFDAAP